VTQDAAADREVAIEPMANLEAGLERVQLVTWARVSRERAEQQATFSDQLGVVLQGSQRI
jgi:hypothetical protein